MSLDFAENTQTTMIMNHDPLTLGRDSRFKIQDQV